MDEIVLAASAVDLIGSHLVEVLVRERRSLRASFTVLDENHSVFLIRVR
jgi:hypothetical protein